MRRRTPSRSDRVYRALLRLFPFDFQREYAEDMECVFRDEQKHSRSRARLWWKTLIGIARTAPAEHVDVLVRDIRHALRSLAKAPEFTVVAVVALAIGIGANVAVFNVANAALIKTLPIPQPERVIRIYEARYSDVPYGRYLQYRDRNHFLSELAASSGAVLTLTMKDSREVVRARLMTGNYFNVMRVAAERGRTIEPADDRAGAAPVVMLGNALWRNRFSSDPTIVGRSVVIEGSSFTVIGIAPAWFNADIAVPWNGPQRSHVDGVEMIGRLREGVSAAQARMDLGTVAALLGRELNERLSISVYPARDLHPELSSLVAGFLLFLMAIAGLVLLIVCLNIASLQYSRLFERGREIGIRLAIGAGRLQLVRQSMTESLLLSCAGCTVSIPIVVAVPRVMAYGSGLGAELIPLDFSLDWRVVTFAIAVSVGATLLFGLVPALHAARNGIVGVLKTSAAVVTSGRSRLRSTFIVAQVAMSVLLLATAGLLVRSLTSTASADRGFTARGVLVATLNLRSAGYKPEQFAEFYNRVLDRLEGVPGVKSANIAGIVPLTLSNSSMPIEADGRLVAVYLNSISRGHFRTLNIPLIAGRDFERTDTETSPPVAIVNELLARRLWPGQNALGKEFRPKYGPPLRVVGVARDSKYIGASEEPKLFVYRPLAQQVVPFGNVLVQTNGDALSVVPGVRSAIRDIDPEVTLFGISTLEQATEVSLVPMKIASVAAASLGVVALILGAIGICGVVSHLARQRTREIGIRIALGAARTSVVGLMTRDAMRWTAAGLILGLLQALFLARLFTDWIYGVSSFDPVTFAGIAALLTTTAYLASWIPARRASRVDPLAALREE